jgi:hypothetical protein
MAAKRSIAGWGSGVWLLGELFSGGVSAESRLSEAEALRIAQRSVERAHAGVQAFTDSSLSIDTPLVALRPEQGRLSEWRLLAFQTRVESAPGRAAFAEPEFSQRGEVISLKGVWLALGMIELRPDEGSRRIGVRQHWEGALYESEPRKVFFDLGTGESGAGSNTVRSRLAPLDLYQLEPFPLHRARILSEQERETRRGGAAFILPRGLEDALKGRSISWTLPPQAEWLEASDFFGRPLLAVWVRGEPWPRYLRGPQGVTILLQDGGVER